MKLWICLALATHAAAYNLRRWSPRLLSLSTDENNFLQYTRSNPDWLKCGPCWKHLHVVGVKRNDGTLERLNHTNLDWDGAAPRKLTNLTIEITNAQRNSYSEIYAFESKGKQVNLFNCTQEDFKKQTCYSADLDNHDESMGSDTWDRSKEPPCLSSLVGAALPRRDVSQWDAQYLYKAKYLSCQKCRNCPNDTCREAIMDGDHNKNGGGDCSFFCYELPTAANAILNGEEKCVSSIHPRVGDALPRHDLPRRDVSQWDAQYLYLAKYLTCQECRGCANETCRTEIMDGDHNDHNKNGGGDCSFFCSELPTSNRKKTLAEQQAEEKLATARAGMAQLNLLVDRTLKDRLNEANLRSKRNVYWKEQREQQEVAAMLAKDLHKQQAQAEALKDFLNELQAQLTKRTAAIESLHNVRDEAALKRNQSLQEFNFLSGKLAEAAARQQAARKDKAELEKLLADIIDAEEIKVREIEDVRQQHTALIDTLQNIDRSSDQGIKKYAETEGLMADAETNIEELQILKMDLVTSQADTRAQLNDTTTNAVDRNINMVIARMKDDMTHLRWTTNVSTTSIEAADNNIADLTQGIVKNNDELDEGRSALSTITWAIDASRKAKDEAERRIAEQKAVMDTLNDALDRAVAKADKSENVADEYSELFQGNLHHMIDDTTKEYQDEVAQFAEDVGKGGTKEWNAEILNQLRHGLSNIKEAASSMIRSISPEETS